MTTMTSRAGNGEGPKPKRRAETENGRMFFLCRSMRFFFCRRHGRACATIFCFLYSPRRWYVVPISSGVPVCCRCCCCMVFQSCNQMNSTQSRASRCVFGNKTSPTSALFLFCVFRPNNKKKLFSSLLSLVSSVKFFSLWWLLSLFSLWKFLLFSFVVLEDLKFSTTTTLVFPLVFFSFVFTRLHRDDGIAVVVVVAVLAVFSDCFLLFVFRVMISSCLFVRSFVFVLVSRGRGGVLEGLGKK